MWCLGSSDVLVWVCIILLPCGNRNRGCGKYKRHPPSDVIHNLIPRFQVFLGNKVYVRRNNRRIAADEESNRVGRARRNLPPRRNSIMPGNTGALTPVPEINEEDEPRFIFTITNSRGETTRPEGGGEVGGRAARGTPRDKLTDAQRVGTDAPPSYDQVVTETRTNNN